MSKEENKYPAELTRKEFDEFVATKTNITVDNLGHGNYLVSYLVFTRVNSHGHRIEHVIYVTDEGDDNENKENSMRNL